MAAMAFVVAVSVQSSALAAGGGVTLRTFAGYWYGHDRGLSISRDGRGYEEISSGCCQYLIKLRFQLSRPRGSSDRALAAATVTWVRVYDSTWFTATWFTAKFPEPHVGQVGTITLHAGVIQEPLGGDNYCGTAATGLMPCGA